MPTTPQTPTPGERWLTLEEQATIQSQLLAEECQPGRVPDLNVYVRAQQLLDAVYGVATEQNAGPWFQWAIHVPSWLHDLEWHIARARDLIRQRGIRPVFRRSHSFASAVELVAWIARNIVNEMDPARQQGDSLDTPEGAERIRERLQRNELTTGRGAPTSPGPERSEGKAGTGSVTLDSLAPTIPALDESSEDWISSKVAAKLLGVETETLANHRYAGTKDKRDNEEYGLHDEGCFWRKRGNAHPYYYRPLMKEHAGHLGRIYKKAKLPRV
jgi:hypothetical protein